MMSSRSVLVSSSIVESDVALTPVLLFALEKKPYSPNIAPSVKVASTTVLPSFALPVTSTVPSEMMNMESPLSPSRKR